MFEALLRKFVKPLWRIRHTRSGAVEEFWARRQAEYAASSRNDWLQKNGVSSSYGSWIAEKNR